MGSLLRHVRTSRLRSHQSHLIQDHMQEKNLIYVTENNESAGWLTQEFLFLVLSAAIRWNKAALVICSNTTKDHNCKETPTMEDRNLSQSS